MTPRCGWRRVATATAGRDADEDQQRRHQEAAADAEHARDEADREAHREQQEDVDRQIGDWKVDLHGHTPPLKAREEPRLDDAAIIRRAAAE